MRAVRTAIVSDLHLGRASGADTLRHPEARERLFAAIRGVDRLVLLGDVLELRELPVGRVLERAGEFLDALGGTLEGAPVAVAAGNHDHQLAGDWLERRRRDGASAPLRLDQTADPPPGSLLARLAERMPRSEVTLVYPGTWIRDDVYAMHGHYLDCHNGVPSLEAVAAGASARITRALDASGPLTPDAYEAALGPLYSLLYELAQATPPDRDPASAGGISLRIWERLNRRDGGFDPLGLLLGRVGIPGLVGALNAAGLGPFRPDLSGRALRRAALDAMREVVARLGIDANHVVFGHTHRSGPLPGDDEDEWALPGGGRLLNSGSWVHEPPLVGDEGPRSPYWPGNCVIVEDTGPPELIRLMERLP
jgi:hypothetical protein